MINKIKTSTAWLLGKIWAATGIPKATAIAEAWCARRKLYLLGALVGSVPAVAVFLISIYFSFDSYAAQEYTAGKWKVVLLQIYLFGYAVSQVVDRYESVTKDQSSQTNV